jgi:hypothetical protein
MSFADKDSADMTDSKRGDVRVTVWAGGMPVTRSDIRILAKRGAA